MNYLARLLDEEELMKRQAYEPTLADLLAPQMEREQAPMMMAQSQPQPQPQMSLEELRRRAAEAIRRKAQMAPPVQTPSLPQQSYAVRG